MAKSSTAKDATDEVPKDHGPVNAAGEEQAGYRDASFPDEKPSESTVAQVEELKEL